MTSKLLDPGAGKGFVRNKFMVRNYGELIGSRSFSTVCRLEKPKPKPLGMSVSWFPVPARQAKSTTTLVEARNTMPVLDLSSNVSVYKDVINHHTLDSLFGLRPGTFQVSETAVKAAEEYRSPFEKRQAKWFWLFERLSKRVANAKIARANAKATPRFSLPVGGRFDVMPIQGDSDIPGCEGFTLYGWPRLERKTPRKGGKNIRALQWMNRCLERKLHFKSLKEKSLHFKFDGFKFRPFRFGRPLVRAFPNSALMASSVIMERFGRTEGSCSEEKFLTESAFLNTWFTCPKSGFKLSWENGYFTFEKNAKEGLDIVFDGESIFHLGEKKHEHRRSISSSKPLSLQLMEWAAGSSVPSSPRDGDSRSMSSVSSAARLEMMTNNQRLLDIMPQLGKADDMDEHECFRRIKLPAELDYALLNPSQVLGFAMSFKARYGCPTKERFEVRMNRSTANTIIRMVPVSSDTPAGLYFYLDSRFWYHCAIDAVVIQKRIWKAIALGKLREANNRGDVVGPKAFTASSSNIPCVQPNFAQQLFGFTVAAAIPGCYVLSRGKDFCRPNEENDSTLKVAVRQWKRFWKPDGRQLVFTMKGIAKVFFRKGEDEKWRFAIARSLGYTVDACTILLRRFLSFEDAPDVIYAETDATVSVTVRLHSSGVRRIKEKVGHLQAVVEPTESQQEVIKIPKIDPPGMMANGDSWLCGEDLESKNHRSLFRHKFHDWWNRISEPALKAMNADLMKDPEYKIRSFNESALVVNPIVDFEFWKTPDVRFELSPLEAKEAEQKERLSKLNLTGLVGLTSLRKTKTVVKDQSERGRVTRSHSQNSSVSVDCYLQSDTVSNNLLFLRFGVPLRHKPGQEASPGYKFVKARDSTCADIEQNPGPPKGKERATTPSPTEGPAEQPQASTSMIPATMTQDTPGNFRPITGPLSLRRIHAPINSWIADDYEQHCVLVQLPTNKHWRFYEPCWSDQLMFVNSCQRSLDSVFVAKDNPFSFGKVSMLADLVKSFMSTTELSEGFDFRSLSALAHFVKSRMYCPTDGSSTAVCFHEFSVEVTIHHNINPRPELRNKLLWCINDKVCLHGGSEEVAAFVPLYDRDADLLRSLVDDSFNRLCREALADDSWPWILDYNISRGFYSAAKEVIKDDAKSGFCTDGPSTRECNHEHRRSTVTWNLIFIHHWLRMTIINFKNSLTGYFHVDTTSDPDDQPDAPNSETLLIGEYGTWGDIIPVRYLVRVARHFGVPTKEENFNTMTSEDLESLREGDFLKFLPKQLHMALSGESGYKKVLLPHVEVPSSIGHSYCLNPPSRYVRDTVFVDDWTKVKWYNFIPAVVATLATKAVSHTWRIGALKGCDLPRSNDGVKPLVKSKNIGRFTEGWTSGSADNKVIPSDVRARCPEIPKGDHSQIFRDYQTVHCHGGAGTVQTAISCGAEPIIHDPTLDRDYHNVPTQSDFKQSSVGSFMGWLVWSGFNPKAPMVVKAAWLCCYAWHMKWDVIYGSVHNILKLYVILEFFRNHWGWLLVIFFTVPTIVWRVLHKTTSLLKVVKMSFWAVWKFPLFCLLDSQMGTVIVIWALKGLFSRLLIDYANAAQVKTELVFEPVERQGVKFWFPFGHWAVRDVTTGDIYEGHFTDVKQTIGSPFKLRKVARPLRSGARLFPAPFNVHSANQMLNVDNEPKPYGPNHNCSTYVTRLMFGRSLTWSIFAGVICGAIYLALSPPDFLARIMRWFYPNLDLTQNPMYTKLGFAAGLEQIPFEPQEEPEMVEPFISPTTENILRLHESDEVLESLYEELSVLTTAFSNAGISTLETEDFMEVGERAFLEEIEKVEIPADSLVIESQIPPYVKHTWAQIVDNLHHSISFARTSRVVDTFIKWLQTVSQNVLTFIAPILEGLSFIAGLALKAGRKQFETLFSNVCHFLDHVWGLEASRRVKTAWGLTGLHRTGMLGVKAKLAANIAYSEFVGRTDFESDYNKLVLEAQGLALRYGATHRRKLGGPQRRPIGYSKPVMNDAQAKLLGFSTDEYVVQKEYSERIESYLESGIPQGADGVFLADKMPELIAKSQHRYEPKYPDLTSDQRQFAKEIAQAMFDKYPDVFRDAGVLPPRAVHNYVKAKYSPGTPFINGKCFKSRQAMFDAGYDKVMQKRAIQKMESGTYDCQFYHAFVKSQVVDIKKCLPFEQGGKNKDVRTVVSQDLFSYYIDQCIQIERNKRINWDTYGAGIGMPLNQSMEKIYSRMADLQKKRGGRYIIADATAFDSFCKPFLFEVNGCLWDLGFKDHPSGNGKNIASVVRASCTARQNGWSIGVTEPEYDSLTLCIPDKETFHKVKGMNHEKLCYLSDILDMQKWNSMGQADRIKYVSKITPPQGKTLITWDPKLRPNKSNWMGVYEFGDVSKTTERFYEHQTLTYEPGDFDGLYNDVRAVATSNYALMSNVHAKNRGGSTGGSDTSNVNTHCFKAGVIYAWCMTTGRTPKEFFTYNDIANTSDDTIWQTGGEFGLNEIENIEEFRRHAADVGIHLEMSTTKNINKVEYLSKFVRTPTAEDSLTISRWRSQKILAIQNACNQRGMPYPDDYKELNNPRFLVVQNPSAILLRRSAFRYYQSSFNKWRYTSVERGAGHALNCAFLPELYEKFAVEWCDDVNHLLDNMGIHRRYAVKNNGQTSLQECMQVDNRAGQQKLSPRQVAFLTWLKGNMFPTYYRVIEVHMNVAKIDPEQHSKFLRKLEKGWRGWNELLREGVDELFRATNAIPDEWSKKFQPGVEMLYCEQPFYTTNKVVEKFLYLKLLEESPEEEITFSDFSLRVQESPYGGACDPYHFWECLQDKQFKEDLHNEEVSKIQGLVFLISAIYMLTTAGEYIVLNIPFIGLLYKLFLWSFIGLNKVYGILNTMYWHSTGKSSREISRVMPKDPYLVSKQLCVFIVDLLPDLFGYLMFGPILVLDMLPPLLECLGKTWYMGSNLKQVGTQSTVVENPWKAYADDYISELRSSPTKRAYVAAKTSTGKSTMFVAALADARHRNKVRKIWLVEPRKVLRDETTIPMGHQTQVLKKGKQLHKSVDIYILTYGHFQSRLPDVDTENDVVLFDEFHEQQGEMILGLATCKAPIFLLSATPADIPSLAGSKFLVPNIDRRHPITIHKTPDSMGVVDMYQEARNRYPELMDRALIIVPTHREVHKVVNALTYLGAGKVTPLSAREREVPKDGVIVATPYVQTGLDIKPPAKILIDCGKDIVFDKGKMVTPLPWTDKDVNMQRIGRVGRLSKGVVLQPESAGSGGKAVKYPSPNLFMHKVVAEHFKMPQLTVLSHAVNSSLPFMRLNVAKLDDLQKQKSVTFIHAMSLHGIRQIEWQTFYTRKQQGKSLGEDYEWLDKIHDDSQWSHVPLLDWSTANYFLFMENVVQYSIEQKERWSLPLSAINGRWQELEHSPTERVVYEPIGEECIESKAILWKQQLDKFKMYLLDQADLKGQTCFDSAVACLG